MALGYFVPSQFNILKQRQNGSHLADDILKHIFLDENHNILILIHHVQKFDLKDINENKSALV